jgi:membrane-bound ClpP family serine protease
MIELLITCGLVILIVGLICLFMDARDLAFLLGVLGAYLLSGGLMMLQGSREPTAMDVYKGKTTLEITYKEGVPVDSVVVFKDKEK